MQPNSDPNPFRPVAPEQLREPEGKIAVDFAPILIRWEKFRVVYNAVLMTLTIVWSVLFLPHLIFDPLFLFHLCVGGIVTNLCFFTGPAIEAYGRYFHVWNIAFSFVLFIVGLSFTGLLTVGFLIVRGL